MTVKPDIHLFEEHSSTLPVWWQHRSSPKTIVYLDAHLDLQQVSEERIAKLLACSRLEEFKALEAPNHLNPSARYAYGIENFLYAAHRLGFIERLIWVAPPHIPRHYSPALIDYMQQMDGLDFEDLTGFEKVGRNALHGSMIGLDITICDYDDLEFLQIGSDYYLDIDIDYFVDVPADRLWIDPAKVINSITGQLGDPSLITISRAVTSGFTPMAYRFIGDYIHDLLAQEEGGNIEYYQELTNAIMELGKGELEAGRSRLEQLMDNHLDIADAYYLAALTTADSTSKNALLQQAEERNSAYQFDLARDSIGLLHRKKKLVQPMVKKLLSALDGLEPVSEQRIKAEVALAQVNAVAGDTDTAMSLINEISGDYADHEDVLLSVVAKQLDDEEKRDENRGLLYMICQAEKNVTTAYLYLGDIEVSDGRYQQALEHFQKACHRAPAWMLPLERMSQCYRLLGAASEETNINKIIELRKKRLSEIVSIN